MPESLFGGRESSPRDLRNRARRFHSARWAVSDSGKEERAPREGEGRKAFAGCLHLKVCWARERLFRGLASAPATSRPQLAGPSLRGSPSRGAAQKKKKDFYTTNCIWTIGIIPLLSAYLLFNLCLDLPPSRTSELELFLCAP